MARERGKGKPRHHMALGTLAFLVLVITAVAARSRKSPDRFGHDAESHSFTQLQTVQVAPEFVRRFPDRESVSFEPSKIAFEPSQIELAPAIVDGNRSPRSSPPPPPPPPPQGQQSSTKDDTAVAAPVVAKLLAALANAERAQEISENLASNASASLKAPNSRVRSARKTHRLEGPKGGRGQHKTKQGRRRAQTITKGSRRGR